MDKDNKVGGAVVLAAVLTGGILFFVFAYREKLLEKAKKRVTEAIQSVDLKDYDKIDRGQIKRLIRKYTAMVSRAKDRVDIYEIKNAFDESLSDFRTTAKKLAEAQIDALKEIYEYGMEKYGKPGSDRINAFAAKYAEQIRHAANKEYVEHLLNEFKGRVSGAFN